jgi:ATP-binding cassette subfamily F protein 3
VLENFYERSGMTIAAARAHLAKFLFSGEDVFKPVSALSGGERSKLALALMVLSPANLLVLDEPTNHLDIYSCDALAESLQRYPGTLLLVSHDRALLDAVTGKTLAFEGHGRVRLFDGPYHAYRDAALAESEAAAAKAIPAAGRNGSNGTGKNGVATSSVPAPTILNAHQLSKERQRAAKRVATLEAEVESLEAQIVTVEAGLSAPASPDEALVLSQRHTALNDALTDALSAWEAATLEAEALGAA